MAHSSGSAAAAPVKLKVRASLLHGLWPQISSATGHEATTLSLSASATGSAAAQPLLGAKCQTKELAETTSMLRSRDAMPTPPRLATAGRALAMDTEKEYQKLDARKDGAPWPQASEASWTHASHATRPQASDVERMDALTSGNRLLPEGTSAKCQQHA